MRREICGTEISVIAVLIVCVIAIILYGIFLRSTKTKDHLATELFHHEICQHIDGWSISHLLFFGLLGVLFPNNHLYALIAGVGWEVIETGLGQGNIRISGKRLQLIGDTDANGYSTGNSDAYWYGKESDIIMDIIGYTIGSSFANKYYKNNHFTCKC